jgi:hypothetical protein
MKSIALVALALAFASALAGQTVIYSDTFAGSGSDDLNGTTPGVSDGGASWVSGTGSSAWKADGSVTGFVESNAFLPFTPEAGRIYTLTATVNPTAAESTGDWLAIGFSGTSAVSDGFQDVQSAAWMLARVDRGDGGIQTFLGPNTDSGADHTSLPDALGLKVVLDTSQSNWRVQWWLGDTLLRSANYDGSNPSIAFVGIGKFGEAGGTVSNFSLSSASPVPEPGTWALLAGGGVLLWAAWRRRPNPRASV